MKTKHNKFKPTCPKKIMEEATDYGYDYGSDPNKIRDLEEKQRILKDRIIIIGENLIETKVEMKEELNEIKKQIDILKRSVEKITIFLETISYEFSKFAKKEDLEILTKQARMFQPLEMLK